MPKGWKLKIAGLHQHVNNQAVKTSRLLPLPVVADKNADEGPGQALETSCSSPVNFAKTANLPDRPWCKAGKKRRSNATCTSDVISNNLQLISSFEGINQLFMFSGVSQNRCVVSVRLVGVLSWLILRGNSKTCFIGFELRHQTVLWLAPSPTAHRFWLTER